MGWYGVVSRSKENSSDMRLREHDLPLTRERALMSGCQDDWKKLAAASRKREVGTGRNELRPVARTMRLLASFRSDVSE